MFDSVTGSRSGLQATFFFLFQGHVCPCLMQCFNLYTWSYPKLLLNDLTSFGRMCHGDFPSLASNLSDLPWPSTLILEVTSAYIHIQWLLGSMLQNDRKWLPASPLPNTQNRGFMVGWETTETQPRYTQLMPGPVTIFLSVYAALTCVPWLDSFFLLATVPHTDTSSSVWLRFLRCVEQKLQMLHILESGSRVSSGLAESLSQFLS